ncbi:imidazole glycerol phosphate synthase subunit HisH [bacterium]|nr:imidazole glycerol phosphate synthase subunit HisH [bacterium]
MTIAVIDYEMGNLKSVSKALESQGASVTVTRDPSVIKNASKIVLPGVGAYGMCMDNLKKFGLVEVIKESIASGKRFLGICLGLQLLFEESEEFGPIQGLGVLKGKVKKFKGDLKVPQIGWNTVNAKKGSTLFKDIENNSRFYFVHSYYVEPQDKSLIASTTPYGIEYCSSVEKDNIVAVQFHPEKSQATGLKMLKNFVELK